jgi:predicted amidohydrolase YtcJ
VHTLERDRTGPQPDAEAVAVRDGHVVMVGSAYDVEFLDGVETTIVDLDGRTVLPGFIDAHTHLEMVGRRAREADLGGATGPSDCLDRLQARRDETDDWVLGFGYDESEWTDSRYLTREDLDAVSTDRPVAAFREDMHLASVNSVVLDRYGADLPDRDVRQSGGDPTGVLVEDALDAVWEAIRPDGSVAESIETPVRSAAIGRSSSAARVRSASMTLSSTACSLAIASENSSSCSRVGSDPCQSRYSTSS